MRKGFANCGRIGIDAEHGLLNGGQGVRVGELAQLYVPIDPREGTRFVS